MVHLICFEDAGVETLAPATTSRPAFTVTCGGYRLIDWLREMIGEGRDNLHAAVRPFLRDICEADHSMPWIDAARCSSIKDSDVLLINGRLAPTISARRTLLSLLQKPSPFVLKTADGRHVIAARLDAEQWSQFAERAAGDGSMVRTLQAMEATPNADDAASGETIDPTSLLLFDWPHDIVRLHMRSIGESLQHRIDTGDYQQLQDGVFAAEGVKIGENCTFDTSEGPVVLDRRVSIGPMSFFSGPVHAADDVRVIEHSSIKDAVSIGHTCKVGGEIEASVLEPYTNKQHHGFLGHSYLGSWINLGAGTCNSDLKNTYGKINATYGDKKVATDMQFFGCVIGDYSKTAINTSIFTGKVIGVCSMMYGFVTSNVPSYVNYARLFGQTSLLPADVMISTQKRMFSRRKVEQRPCDAQLIRDMYTLTAGERAADADLL